MGDDKLVKVGHQVFDDVVVFLEEMFFSLVLPFDLTSD